MNYIILDRDGVVNIDSPHFIKTVAEWHPIPGSLEAIVRLKKAGFKVFVASNQSGIGRGLITLENSEAIFNHLKKCLDTLGSSIDGIVFCPHHPDDNCDCRKPKPGLFFQIRDQFGIHLNQAYAVGDSLRDLESAEQAGAKPILVRTGNGLKTEKILQEKKKLIPIYNDLAHFTKELLDANQST